MPPSGAGTRAGSAGCATQSSACSGNSRWRWSKNSSVSAHSSSECQKSDGVWEGVSIDLPWKLTVAMGAVGLRLAVIFGHFFTSRKFGQCRHRLAREVLIGVTMALQAPFHVQGFFTVHQRHPVHLAMAHGAADAFPDVNPVMKEGEVRKVVHAHPAQSLASVEAVSNGPSTGLSAQSCEWQSMQSSVLGMPAKALSSTV